MRYLSYNPLHAPRTAAATSRSTQTFDLKSMPSFFPLRLSIQNEKMATQTPAHWSRFSLSPKISIAPTSVMTGLVALTGPTMVSGSFFMAKYPQIHDDSTTKALIITNLCSRQPPSGIYRLLSGDIIPVNEPTMEGRKNRVQITVFMRSTGMTAFPCSDFFLNTS